MRRYRDFILDAFQREALEAIRQGLNIIVAAPTGCGKTLVAEYAIERALEHGERIIYTAPIKALSNQKFRDFEASWGERVGIMTGDVTINPAADALIMTTEIFRNTIFDNPSRLRGTRYVVLDEVHYLDDPERGTVWEESIIFAPPEIRFIALSATISNLHQFAAWVRKVRPGGLRIVLETERPVPLHPYVFTGEEVLDLKQVHGRAFSSPKRWRAGPGGGGPGREVGRGRRRGQRPGGGAAGRPRRTAMSFVQQNFRLIDHIVERDHLPCIFFLFSRDACERMAIASMNRDLVTAEERERLKAQWDDLRRHFDLAGSLGAERVGKLLLRGIAYHHAGMLPTLKEVVERFFTSGLIKLLFATETFSLGVNMPARAVAFESLKKFDGVKRDYMKAREFLQMAGRAGRRGHDEEGFVYACVQPETERPSEVRRVMEGEVEAVESQFNLAYATLLTLYSHLGEEIYRACEQSFVHFRHKRKKGAPFLDMLSQVKRRIRLLQDTGFLAGQRLTPKGRFASLIYGYEIQAAELWEGGLLRELGPHELAVLVTALVHESKRDTWFVPLARGVLEPIRRPARDLIEPFREREQACGIATLTKRPDWNLSRAAWEWTHESAFDGLAEWTDASPGDLVRTFRLGIQLLRQLAKPLRFVEADGRLSPSAISKFKQDLREAAWLMKRGEVDAERQLRQAVRVEAGEEAVARIPKELDVAEETADDEVALEHVLAPRRAGEPAEVEIDLAPPAGGPSPSGDEEVEWIEDGGEREAPPDGPRPRHGDFGWLPSGEDEDHGDPELGRRRRGRRPRRRRRRRWPRQRRRSPPR